MIGQGLWASWTSLFCSVLFYSGDQKCPSSSLETFYCHILFFRLCCLYYLEDGNPFIRIWSSASVWGGCGDFWWWVGRKMTLKYLSWKKEKNKNKNKKTGRNLNETEMATFTKKGRPTFDPWVRKISWKRKWQPTPVFLLGKSHGRRNLVGYSPWGRKESDTTEWLHRLHLYWVTLWMNTTFPHSHKAAFAKGLRKLSGDRKNLSYT